MIREALIHLVPSCRYLGVNRIYCWKDDCRFKTVHATFVRNHVCLKDKEASSVCRLVSLSGLWLQFGGLNESKSDESGTIGNLTISLISCFMFY